VARQLATLQGMFIVIINRQIMELSKSRGISSTLMLSYYLKTIINCNLGLNVYSNNVIVWHSNLFDESLFCLFVSLTGKT